MHHLLSVVLHQTHRFTFILNTFTRRPTPLIVGSALPAVLLLLGQQRADVRRPSTIDTTSTVRVSTTGTSSVVGSYGESTVPYYTVGSNES